MFYLAIVNKILHHCHSWLSHRRKIITIVFLYMQYRMYQVRTKSSAKPLKFRLCDTRGLEDSQGIDAHDLTFLLDGNVPDGYHVSKGSQIGIGALTLYIMYTGNPKRIRLHTAKNQIKCRIMLHFTSVCTVC